VSEKQKFINTVVNDALKNVPKHKDYLKFLQDLIRKTNERDGELFLTKADYTKLGKRLKDFLKKEGFCYTLKTTNEIKGGLIIKKGKLTYLCSIDMISEILRNSLAIDVSRILFKEVVNGNS
jgi:vacuolar-type H+-ATPase subunit E/Vma4